MLRLTLRPYMFIGLCGLIGLTVILAVRQGMAQTSVIPADVAVNLALSYGKDDGYVGGLVDQPTGIYGRVLTYGEAVQYIFARPVNPNDGMAKIQNHPVWLIILQGKFVEHVPAAADIPAKDVIHDQMALIMDGNTGEIIERVLIAPQMKLPITTLQALAVPAGTAAPAPTRSNISTEVPFPTTTP